MELLWTKLEKEFNVELSDMDRKMILSTAVSYFIDVDLRHRQLEGYNYTKNPEKYREELIRKTARSYLKGKGRHEPDSDSSKSEQSGGVTEKDSST